MAGLGRRTHYRKHLTDAVLNDLPEPKQNERIAKVFATRGGNQFDVILAAAETTTTSTEQKRTPQLAILPTKFNKLIWLKRNDFVIVETGEATTNEEEDDSGGIRFIVSHILYKEQVKHLQKRGLWPKNDPEFSLEETTADEDVDAEKDEEDEQEEQEAEGEDGIVYNTGLEDDDDFFVNTNRIASLKVCDSSSSSSDSE